MSPVLDGAPTSPTTTKSTQMGSRLRDLWSRRWVQDILILFLYLGISAALMAPKVAGQPNGRVLSSVGSEASIFVWSLRWWPYALGHGLNPLFTHVAWAPFGLNLSWVTTTPLLGILAAPLTLTIGPIATFNLLTLVAPGLSAWTAYLLCRRITGNCAASVAGGYFFGYSAYLMSEVQRGHLNMDTLFLIPVAAYLVLRSVDGSLRPRRFVPLLALTLVAEFGVFAEFAATMTVVGALVGAFAWLTMRDLRPALRRTAGWVALAYGVAAVVLSPYLYAMVAYPEALKPAGFTGVALGLLRARNLLFYFVPSTNTLVGHGVGEAFRFGVNPFYFGVPLLVILIWHWIARRDSRVVRAAMFACLVSVVLAMGPSMEVGSRTVPLPWRAAAALPLLDKARAGRIILFAFLAAAVCVAMWMSERRWRPARWGLVVLAAIAILPNVTGSFHAKRVQIPTLFTSRAQVGHLAPGEIVLVIDPVNGRQMYWQAQAGMSFRLAGWYSGFYPANDPDRNIVLDIESGNLEAVGRSRLISFLSDRGVGAIIVGHAPTGTTEILRRWLQVSPRRVGGLTIFQLS